MANMLQQDQKELVADLARDLVAIAAPHELPLFRAVSEAYLNDPERALKAQRGKDEMLGFGMGEAAVLLSPIILAVVTDVLRYVTEHVLQTVKSEGAALASGAVKNMFKKFRGEEKKEGKVSPLTAEQIAQVRRLSFERARQLDLPEAQAGLLADAVAGSLALAS